MSTNRPRRSAHRWYPAAALLVACITAGCARDGSPDPGNPAGCPATAPPGTGGTACDPGGPPACSYVPNEVCHCLVAPQDAGGPVPFPSGPANEWNCGSGP